MAKIIYMDKEYAGGSEGAIVEDMTTQEVEEFVDSLDAQGANLVDYVVEQGTDGIWTYRKWSSGIAECWGEYSVTISHYSTALGGYAYYTNISFPSDLFISAPIPVYSAYVNGYLAIAGTITGSLTKDSCNYYAVSNASGSHPTRWYITAKGRWK